MIVKKISLLSAILSLSILFSACGTINNRTNINEQILSEINSDISYLTKMEENFAGFNWNLHDDAIAGLNDFSTDDYIKLKELFPGVTSIDQMIP